MPMIRKGSSLNQNLNTLFLVCFVPLAVVIVYLLFLVNHVSDRYDVIVNNITTANVYNLHLKEELDYTMYVIVVNAERAYELVDTDPHELINAARKDFQGLEEQAEQDYAKTRLSRIVKSLDTLEDRVTEIEEDAQTSGMYDTNLERLDMNIRIVTDLIQDEIQEYIYYEAKNLEMLRLSVRTEARRSLEIAVSISLLVLIGTLLISRNLRNRLTAGISQLRMVTKKAGHGDFTVRAELEDSQEELKELGDGFNQMVERIGELVEDIRIEQLNLRQMEQKLLQAQINPHFLYNTLDTIIWLAETGEKDQVIMMVTALSDFFRTTLSKGRDFISVKEEESHIRSYLQIQQFRYQDILEYEIDIPEEMHQYQILKLTLQPLVENALYHGIKNKRGMGHIRVSGHLEDGRLVFQVTDNGMGMTPEKLASVQQAMKRNENDQTTDPSVFGLYNVEQRIRLNYGPGYGIWLSSTYGEGTEAYVEIPAKISN
ncbi:MAG: histidine kinase [Eubacteriales bacterium]|nr:histidine kinase [Eubacteriales bacterium]